MAVQASWKGMITMATTKAIVRSEYKSDGNGGLILRCWAEGRLWPIGLVRQFPMLWEHTAGCPECSWGTVGMIELCDEAVTVHEAELAAEASLG